MQEVAFSAVSRVAIAGWSGLAIASPMQSGSFRNALLFICGRVVPILLCIAYIAFLAHYWGSTPRGGFQSLEGVQLVFAAPGKMLGAWTHCLAFDLLVGRWMVDDASSGGHSRATLVLALPATFMFGPLGVVLYFAGRVLLRAKAARGSIQ